VRARDSLTLLGDGSGTGRTITVSRTGTGRAFIHLSSCFRIAAAVTVGARAGAGAGGLPRAPGGGVGVPYSEYLRASSNSDAEAMDRLRYGPNGGISLVDESFAAGAAHDAHHVVQQSGSLKMAQQLAAAGVANPLEAVNPQAQAVLRREKKRDKKMGRDGGGKKKKIKR